MRVAVEPPRYAGSVGGAVVGKPRSQAAKDATIRTFARRSILLKNAELYRGTLQAIVDVYDMRSELFTSDEELAANLYDRARLALVSREDRGE